MNTSYLDLPTYFRNIPPAYSYDNGENGDTLYLYDHEYTSPMIIGIPDEFSVIPTEIIISFNQHVRFKDVIFMHRVLVESGASLTVNGTCIFNEPLTIEHGGTLTSNDKMMCQHGVNI